MVASSPSPDEAPPLSTIRTAGHSRRVRPLRTHLSTLLVTNALLTYLLVMAGLVLWRLPATETENRAALKQEVHELSARVELLLSSAQYRIALLTRLADEAGDARSGLVLRGAAMQGRPFNVLYWLTDRGTVIAMDAANGTAPGIDLVGHDLSTLPLVRKRMQGPGITWSGDHLSPVTGITTIAIATRDADSGRMLIGEIAPDYLYQSVQAASRTDSSRIWMVTPSGGVLAETGSSTHPEARNIRNLPVMQALLDRRPPPERMQYQGRTLGVVTSLAPSLGWYFIGIVPLGLDSPQVLNLLAYATGTFVALLLTGLLLAPFWSRHLARSLNDIVDRAATAASGHGGQQAWPHGSIAEFNTLSDDLARMARTLQQRERKLHAIFNATPVPMAVVNAGLGNVLQEVNDAWCHALGRTREEVLGHRALDIGFWRSTEERDTHEEKWRDGAILEDTTLLHKDGRHLLFQTYGREVALEGERLRIMGSVKIGPLRRAEQELRELNTQLEARIERRTQALAASNEELRATVEHLQLARDELVRAEKMAALGALVAGVAHELNTPLGNGVMAVSTMREATREFRKAMEAGLRRTDLQHFLEQVDQGTDISARNLHRAADLVQSFKQVAVDQTSSQRRSFELHEVVHEMVVSLRPSFSRTPYRIEVEVPSSGLRMDSYPGALGQAIGNMIQNAIVHGFDGRAHGTVRVEAGHAENGRIVLRVTDDGCGIPAHLIDRVFEPFVTTKMGQGGTGLGLHISYNAIINLLGGTLTVQSREGHGTCFEMRLPDIAPHVPTATR